MTFLILRAIGLFVKLRAPDEVLETGDLAAHDEEAYPLETAVATSSVHTAAAAAPSAAADPDPAAQPPP
jgi:Amt family ammonium transporter